MIKKFVTLLVCLLFLPIVILFSQENININGQIRYRFERTKKGFDKETHATNNNYLRTRINLFYQPTSNLNAFFQLQDSRIFGEENNTLDGSARRLDMHQVYLNIDSLFQIPLSLQLGRFEAAYGNERLIGAVGWHNVGRSFDGGTLVYKSDLGSIDLFSFQIKNKYQTIHKKDLFFLGIWGNLKLTDYLKTDFYILKRKEPGCYNLNEHTLGLNISGNFGNLKAIMEAAYQTGRLDSLRDISASLLAINLKYGFPDISLRPEILAGIDYLSGDDNIEDKSYTVFNTLYATNHKFYGIMDYFIDIPVQTGGYGLTDINAGISAVYYKNSKVQMRYHRFISSKKYFLPDNSHSGSFGDEIDIIVNYWYNQFLIIETGGGLFFPGTIFKATRGRDTDSFFYVSFLANL